MWKALTERIALRIALAMMPALVLALSVFAVATAVREGEVIELEMQRDADAVATGLAAMLERAGVPAEEAREWLADIDRQLPYLHIRLAVLETSEASVPEALVAPIDLQGNKRVVARSTVEDAAGTPRAVVIVTEPLADRDAFVRRALFTDAVGVLVATIMGCAFAVAIGRSLVGRRVDRVIERLTAVGRGEYPDQPLLLGEDELGTLGRAADEMTAQLRSAREQAAAEAEGRRLAQLQVRRADRLTAVGRTVAVFAHEVGTPLNVISGHTDRLSRNAPPELHRHLSIIREQTDRITAFVRRLLDYARHDDGFAPRSVSLPDVVRRAAALAGSRNVRLELAEATVIGDHQGLEQVVTNLVANALDASPADAPVVVRVERVECDAGAGRDLPRKHVHLVVEDQGPGIPADLRERVFTPFYTTKAAGEGTGLGLSIVQEIVHDHGGTVTIEEPVQGGSRFVVHLPGLGERHG